MWFAPFEKLGQRRVSTQLQREADGEGHSLLLGWIDANPPHSMRCCQRWTARSVHKANAYDTDEREGRQVWPGLAESIMELFTVR